MATKEAGDDKKKALTMALSQIEKQFGKVQRMTMGDQTIAKIPKVSTCSFGQDIALVAR